MRREVGRRFGPGFLVAAAFIGPGTVTTASLAGAQHGYALAWAVVAAIGATLVLQEMAARLDRAREAMDKSAQGLKNSNQGDAAAQQQKLADAEQLGHRCRVCLGE